MTRFAMRRGVAVVVAFAPVPAVAGGEADWVTFVDETAGRLVAAPSLGADDPEEKDFAWGDLDADGDVDLVVARKQPFSSAGRRPNVLLMNEGGILVDRTAEFAAASDVPGDQGFLTPTNDRDVVIVDVDNDGWLDVVTATTLSDGLATYIGHPRVYRNLGGAPGAWLGLRYESARIPTLHSSAGIVANPRFNAVAAGDVTGDGAPDLFFVDSDFGLPAEDPDADINDRLLVNDGNGFFVDGSGSLPPNLLETIYATSAAIADVNGDGINEIVRSAWVGGSVQVAILYRSGAGTYDIDDVVYQGAPTFVSVADLDGDGRLDLVVTEDNTDRYLVNIGNEPGGLAAFTPFVFPGSDPGFGGNSVVADLDGDGATDVIVTDVDTEIAGCTRPTRFFRQGAGPGLSFAGGLPDGIADGDRVGVHDAAVFDINGDGALDLVLGRCVGTRVWINVPPCAGDLDADGAVAFGDVLLLLGAWGPCPPPCPADLNGDGAVTFGDVLLLLGAWGPCSP